MTQGASSLFSQHVGNRIRFYRKQKHLSQEQLAAGIHKSKSALSKYESGQIPVDTETLYDIATVLGVEVSQFVDCPIPAAETRIAPTLSPFGGDILYLYYYDGRTKRTVKTRLELLMQECSGNEIPCRCYMDAPSFEDYEQCKYYYTGLMTHFELVSYVTLLNHSNPMEQIGLCILNPFHRNRDTWGFMFGISYNPITPFALKFLLSTRPLEENELQAEDLTLTKSELKMIKNLNMMLLNTQEP